MAFWDEFLKDDFEPISESLIEDNENIPTRLDENIIMKDTTEQKFDTKTAKKYIIKTLPATLKNIRKALDKTKITQDDKWFLSRYFTRNKISTIRVKESDLSPILLNFFNKKLKTS